MYVVSNITTVVVSQNQLLAINLLKKYHVSLSKLARLALTFLVALLVIHSILSCITIAQG